ncbi:hypothetical protein [Pedobacter sp.]|uniref:hypothetical protein n=1 Tax=Pedobacter sp. TaxID=1411316 RepID=UPI0031DE5FAF
MKRIFKWILTIIGIISGTLIIIYFIGITSFMILFGKRYNAQDLIENYKTNSKQITEIITYINSITPKDTHISLEFESNRNLGIFHVNAADISDNNWDLNINSTKTEFLLKKLGWSKATLLNIKEKLDEVDCISIENGNPFTIGYQRSGMAMFSYKIFEKPLTDSEHKQYNDGCMFMQYNNNVVLEYGSGATGSLCYGDFKTKKKVL